MMKYISYLSIGTLFGIVMTKSQAISWYRIYEMFRFDAFHMYGIIGSAVAIGIVIVALIKKYQVKSTEGTPITISQKNMSIPRYLIGGTIFGLGWAMAGACPGPMYTLLGNGYGVILVVLATVTAVGLKYGLRIPLIGILATYVGNAMGAAAAVIIGWYWAPRFLNPAVAIPSLALLLVNAAVAVQGSSSRRDIIAVFAGFIWGVYFSRVRFMRMRSYLPTLGVVSAIGIVVVASFTSVRGSGADRDRSPMEHLQAMLTGTDLVAGLYDLGSGQQAAGISMWIIDNHPETYPFRGPATLKYIYEIPIPRMMWPEKPNPLSIEIPKMARIRGVGYGEYNVGPGVVGQSYSDFGPAAVLLYAILLGIMIRFADDLVWRSPRDIFVIAAVGSGLGQILAIPRGDVSLFTFVFLVGFAGCYVCMLVFAKILRLEAGPAAVSQAGQPEVLDGMTGSDAEFQPTPATPSSDGYRNYAELGPA